MPNIQKTFTNTLLGYDMIEDEIEKSLLFHIPHAKTKIPDNLRKSYLVSDEVLNKEIELLTNYATDQIFDGYENRIVFDYSRVFCDVERFSSDKDEPMADYGRGFYYVKTDAGIEFRNEIDKDIVLNQYYKKHHENFTKIANRIINSVGFVQIVDCHSFNNEPLQTDLNKDKPRPDFCIGTCANTEKMFVTSLYNYLTDLGYKVEYNKPYEGTIIPQNVDLDKVYSFMIEINKKLYMDEKNKIIEEKVEELKNIFKLFFIKE